MVSIVIASADSQLLLQVQRNIADTIGVAYEVLAFDNKDAARGICAIYNEGLSLAKYETICFMHEDIAFETQDWGKVVTTIFEDNPKLGLIGVAGSTYKSITPSGWLSVSDIDPKYCDFIQSHKYTDQKILHHFTNPDKQTLPKVVALDGMWLCATREAAQKVRFDDSTFKKFHCYDIDFSLAVGQYYDVAVTFDILIHHFSEGRFDCEWLAETIKFHTKWDVYLPKSTGKLTPVEIYTLERQNFKYFFKKLLLCDYPMSTAYKLVWRSGYYRKKLGLKLFLKFNFYFIRFSTWAKPKKSSTQTNSSFGK